MNKLQNYYSIAMRSSTGETIWKLKKSIAITEKNLNQKYKSVLIFGTAKISQIFGPKFELE